MAFDNNASNKYIALISSLISPVTGNSCIVNVLTLGSKTFLSTDILYLTKSSISLVGAILNAVSLYLFCKSNQRRKGFVILLMLLSIAETVYGIGAFIFEIYYLLFLLHSYPLLGVQTSLLSGYLVLYAIWIMYKTSLLTRNWLIVIIAWHRYRAIQNPLSAQRTLSRKKAGRLFAMTYALCLAVTAPRAFEMGYELCIESTQFSLFGDTYLMKNESYVNIYLTLFFLVTSPLPHCRGNLLQYGNASKASPA